jgi:putative ABC transport system ATP-binding protein
MNMDVIRMENVTRYYQVGQIETPALRGVDLTITDGEFSAVVGPSGSGKTTLLQLMGCLDKPTSGKVFIKEEDVTQLNARQRADLRKGTIGFIFQFFALIPGLTAYENVEMPLLLSGAKREDRKKRVGELLEGVGLSDRAHHRPDQMSGGEQQRVAIARALSTRPAVVLADEPTANLDGDTGHQVMEIMERLNKDTGTTFFFATHDPRVLPFVHRKIVLRDGLVDENSQN